MGHRQNWRWTEHRLAEPTHGRSLQHGAAFLSETRPVWSESSGCGPCRAVLLVVPRPFVLVHRVVGGSKRAFVADGVFVDQCEAGADRDREALPIAERERRCFDEALEVADNRGCLCFAAVREQKGEFVTADPRDQVRFAQSLRDRGGDLFERVVAGQMAVGVVDLLEIVDVEDHQRCLLRRSGGRGQHVP